MAPSLSHLESLHDALLYRRQEAISKPVNWNWRAAATDEEFAVESWSQGFMVGALVIMACITIANMRRHVLLHKLILAEQLLALSHGTFCFMSFKGYGWYLSSTAALLYVSWIIHNIVAWMKVRPFFSQPGGFFKPKFGMWTERIYLSSLALAVPVILFQISNNFRFFNNRGGWYRSVRPYEPVFRDPWWVFTCLVLFHVVRKCYGTGVIELVKRSPRFGILLLAIFLSTVFTICDIIASATPLITVSKGGTDGINPWWKLALVFKCLTDTILLDDFKTELKRLGAKRIVNEEKARNSMPLLHDNNPAIGFRDNTTESTNYGNSSGKKRATWYGSQNQSQNSEPELSPTTTLANSSSTSANRTNQPLKDPNTAMDNLDFHTALDLGPSGSNPPEHIEYASSRNSTERYHINSRTTRISHLPVLQEFRWEAIKPGKPSKNKSQYDSDDSDEIENQPTRLLADLRAQARLHSIVPNDSDRIEQQPIRGSTDLRTQARFHSIVSNDDQGGIHSQLHDMELSKARERSERIQRERRFRQSIGADDRG